MRSPPIHVISLIIKERASRVSSAPQTRIQVEKDVVVKIFFLLRGIELLELIILNHHVVPVFLVVVVLQTHHLLLLEATFLLLLIQFN